MKISIITFCSLFMCVVSFTALSQTAEQRDRILAKYDLEKLMQLAEEAGLQFERNRQAALELAPLYGWVESYETENGGQGLLVGYTEGPYPLYYETTNEGAGITTRANRIHTGGVAGLDLNGENMLIGVWDGGRVRVTHEIFEGRVTHIDDADDDSNHATHVSGTIIGSGAFQGGDVKGMAPLAEIISSDFNNSQQETLNAISDYGILLSNHSYGVRANTQPSYLLGKYDFSSRLWDVIHYTSPYHLGVFSAGNARNTNHANQGDGGYDILTSLALSKNTMVVAATFQVLNYVGPNSVIMTGFSSWGPTDDGRIKPDISAKGFNTLSSISDGGDSAYGLMSGTSMSAPSVTGTLALLQQHYSNLNSGEFMLASTLKGLAIHTADEAGLHPGPDYRFGWGLLNAEKAAEVLTNNGTTSTVHELTVMNGSGYAVTGTAIPGERLVVSLTWTDVEGSPTGNNIEDDDTPMLVNDMDIRIIDEEGTVYYPWILDHTDFAAPATNGDNYRDNVEKIEIDNPDGEYTITVTHKGTLENDEQVVSLIITGIENTVLGSPDNSFVDASIYPNPATNVLNVQAKAQISEVEITNLLGQSMGVQKVNSNNAQIDINNLSAGTYFVRVTIDNASSVYKFIKK